ELPQRDLDEAEPGRMFAVVHGVTISINRLIYSPHDTRRPVARLRSRSGSDFAAWPSGREGWSAHRHVLPEEHS
ncbi:hypothetical protein KHP57_23290, partial [Algiphilus sp. NNCM1]|nr:hypothetical protein [Algiphilus acroporae]